MAKCEILSSAEIKINARMSWDFLFLNVSASTGSSIHLNVQMHQQTHMASPV